MLNIVFVEPEIPYNTGALSRTCVLTKSKLHLVEPLSFSLDDKNVKRAGLDYLEYANIEVHKSFMDLYKSQSQGSFYFATTKAKRFYTEVDFKDGDFIVFGKESKGLDPQILNLDRENNIKIPIAKESTRSLNLANAANIILYEALRQLDFPGLS